MEHRYKTEMIALLNASIKARLFENRAVLLFGHCNATEEMVNYLLNNNIVPVAILDNSVSKQGGQYCGVPIVSPETAREYSHGVVLIATRFFAEMMTQLRQLGYDGEVIQVVEYNSFAEYSLDNETIMRKKERMLRGVKTIEKIRAKYPQHHLVICPNDALGDVYWAMSFLQAYLRKHGINEVCVVVIGERGRQVVNLFDEYPTVELDHKSMDEFVQAVIFTKEGNCIIANHDRPYTDNIIKYLDRHFLSYIDYYKYAVYGLEACELAVCPVSFSEFDNYANIPKGESVIISPYAKSVVELSPAFWETIISDYKRNGYQVYTNVQGHEHPLDGTKPLTIPIPQIMSAVEYAGIFCGIRSGLCDLIFSANCHKTVVFPDCHYSTTPHKVKDFFALPGWNVILSEKES